MEIKPYIQTTYETCLPSCLIMLLSLRSNPEEEIEIWRHGWSFERKYCTYVIGQLNYVASKWGVHFELIIENKGDYYINEKLALPQIKTRNSKIDLELIKKNLGFGPVILYVDSYYIPKYINKSYHSPPEYIKSFYHYPHFILILSLKRRIKIIDSLDGKVKFIKKGAIKNAIASLRSPLSFSPFLIRKLNKKY